MRRPEPERLTLRPVTLARHLAVRALAGCRYVDGEGGDGPPPDLASLPDDDLIRLVETASEAPAGALFPDRSSLVAVATAVWEAWSAEAQRQTDLGATRARLVVLHTGCRGGSGVAGPPPPPEIIAGSLTLPEWAAVRDLPLWEATLHGVASASVATFRARTATN